MFNFYISAILISFKFFVVKAQYRYVHTDVDLPSYKNLRRTSTIEPTIPAKETNEKRKAFTYLSTVGLYF